MNEDQKARFARFDEMGEEAVRQYAFQIQGEPQRDAYKWLKQRSDAKDRRDSEQAEVAKSSQRAAWAAVVISVIALIASVAPYLKPA